MSDCNRFLDIAYLQIDNAFYQQLMQLFVCLYFETLTIQLHVHTYILDFELTKEDCKLNRLVSGT